MKKNFITEKLMWHISALGTSLFMLILILTVFLLGQVALAIQLLIGLLLVFIVLIPIKLLFYKDRPHRKNHRTWLEKLDAASFPSAHSNRAALLLVILSFFFANIPLTILFLVISLIVAYSRIYLKRHYWVDVLIGYCIGILEGILIVFFV